MRRQRTNETSAAGTAAADRPRILYISYDGIGEPLGRSQVLGYLFRLASDFEITLLSFEKPEADLASLTVELRNAGIKWVPHRYHRRPPVLSTLVDVLAAGRTIRRLSERFEIAHVRSYVPALIALVSGRGQWNRLLFDIRGFWVDERVEGGIWPAGGWLYRLAKRCERWFFAEADAVVTLTEASRPQIQALISNREIPIVVIPTCVDLEKFDLKASRAGGPHAVWSGSIGTWYRFDLAAPMSRALGLPLTVITRQREEAMNALKELPAELTTLSAEEVPQALHSADVGLCLVKSSFSKTASAPTRFAEYLAAGMPVVATPGVGDLEALVVENSVGVVLRSGQEEDLLEAARSLRALLADPGLAERCRNLAVRMFDVEAGSHRYAALYSRLLREAGPAPVRGR